MEEILASIRRIIEDSDAGSEAAAEKGPASGNAQSTPSPRIEQESSRDGRPQGEVVDVEAFRSELKAVKTGEASSPFQGKTTGLNENTASREDEVRHLEPDLAVAGAAGEDETYTAEESMQAPARAAGVSETQLHGQRTSSDLDAKSSILSEQTGRQVAAAFGELNEAFEASRRRNVDQMAEEMLRPMLQEWLDENLPSIVERLVREEIERLARGS